MYLLDHLFVIFIFVFIPLYQYYYGARKMEKEYAGGLLGPRKEFCLYTIAIQWGITIPFLFLWWLASRGASELGFSSPGGWLFWISIVISIALISVLVYGQKKQTSTPEGHAKTKEALFKAAPFMPQQPRELKLFMGVSITAGVCEEIVFRGYLIWYVSQFTGTDISGMLMAVLVTSFGFGLGHLYQGINGASQVFAGGLLFGGIYLLSGSLWVPMAAHALVDILAALSTIHLYSNPPPSSETEDDEKNECTAPQAQSTPCST